MELYQILANLTYALHLIVMALIFFGTLLAMKYPKWWTIQMPLVATTVMSQMLWMHCPLTLLENYFRSQYDPEVLMSDGFIARICIDLFGLESLPYTPIVQTSLLFVAFFTYMIYTNSKSRNPDPESVT